MQIYILTCLQITIAGETGPAEAEIDEQQLEVRDEQNEEKGDAEAAPEEANEGGENDNEDNQQKPAFPNAFGFNGMNGQFPNMNFGGGGGDFNQMNQMQMMMAMQNGMAPNGFGFSMMGKFYLLVNALPFKTQRHPKLTRI